MRVVGYAITGKNGGYILCGECIADAIARGWLQGRWSYSAKCFQAVVDSEVVLGYDFTPVYDTENVDYCCDACQETLS